MSLYTPAHFAIHERAPVARLIHDHAFATLITPTPAEPLISHLPLLLVPGCEPYGTLIGHVARANPHWRAGAGLPSIAVFHGPHAYVSPSWYAAPQRAVPTWNYATVHAHGTLAIIEDECETRAILDLLIQRFESHRAVPWRFAMHERERDALVGAIVAFRLQIRRIDAKFKLSQNRAADDQRRIRDGLRGEPYADAAATADWMEAYAAAGSPLHDDR